MKKLLMVALAVIMICSCLTVGVVFAEEAPAATEMILYAKVDNSWKNPHVWAFTSEGVAAFDAWPGQAMIADANNAGWYYVYLPVAMDKVIVSATVGEGDSAKSVQTVDLALPAKTGAWLEVGAEITEGDGKGNYAGTISATKATTGDLPEYVALINILAYVPEDWTGAGVWAWVDGDGTGVFQTWPGGAMTKQSDGWYSLQIPAKVKSTKTNEMLAVNKIIINEAKDGGKQTADFDLDQSKLSSNFIPNAYIVVDKNSADMTKADAEVAYDAKPDVQPKFIVHAKVPSDWLLPSIWAWSHPDGTGAFANWPGPEMTEDGEWYTYKIPEFCNRVIINDGVNGGSQTIDLEIESKELWVVVGEKDDSGKFTATITYEEPTPAPVPSTPEGLSTGAIVGIVVACVAVVAGAVVAVVLLRKKKSV